MRIFGLVINRNKNCRQLNDDLLSIKGELEQVRKEVASAIRGSEQVLTVNLLSRGDCVPTRMHHAQDTQGVSARNPVVIIGRPQPRNEG